MSAKIDKLLKNNITQICYAKFSFLKNDGAKFSFADFVKYVDYSLKDYKEISQLEFENHLHRINSKHIYDYLWFEATSKSNGNKK